MGTASAGKHELVLGLGADEDIDRRNQDVVAAAPCMDVPLVPFVGAERLPVLESLRPGGLLVALLPVGDLVEQGLLRPHAEQVYPLADAAQAHARGETGRVTGKLVLAVGAARPAQPDPARSRHRERT